MQFEGALAKLNENYFFREFTFSTNTFKTPQKAELELADAVVWLKNFLIVIQVKQRYASFGATVEDEANWFRNEVLGKAVTQVGNTLQYLRSYDSIELANNQGHTINLADAKDKRVHKLVVYHPNDYLPDSCSSLKFQMSPDVGVVHLFRSDDYFGVLKTLITPVEVEEYLGYREELIKRWGSSVNAVNEGALIGHFLRNLPELPPSPEFVEWLVKSQQASKSEDDWNISRIISVFAERRNTPQKSPVDYYGILEELASLNRTGMDLFKARFFKAMQLANADSDALPYRFQASEGGCAFVFVPVQRKDVATRDVLLANLTELNKYELKADRCIGLSFVSEGKGSSCDVRWCFVERPWVENEKLESILKESYPFRPTKTEVRERYGL